MSVPDILFVCARNAVRSPMAEALYNAETGGGAISCGLAPAGFADGHMLTVMQEIGHNLSDFEPQGLDSIGEHPRRVICLTEDIAETARTLAVGWSVPIEVWNIPDPSMEGGPREARLQAYRAARDAIAGHIGSMLGASSEVPG